MLRPKLDTFYVFNVLKLRNVRTKKKYFRKLLSTIEELLYRINLHFQGLPEHFSSVW